MKSGYEPWEHLGRTILGGRNFRGKGPERRMLVEVL